MEWISENWINITAAVGGIYTVASVIVRLTPTPKDDALLDKARSMWDKILVVANIIFTSSNRRPD